MYHETVIKLENVGIREHISIGRFLPCSEFYSYHAVKYMLYYAVKSMLYYAVKSRYLPCSEI